MRFSRKASIVIIVVCVLAVTVATLAVLLNSSERTAKGRIESVARDYYENYFYNHFTKSIPAADFESVMEKYTEHGFSEVPLRQLLFYNGGKNADLADELGKYCDLNATSVRFVPEAPFGKTNYHADYKYSCNF